jgi:hypothetical protein
MIWFGKKSTKGFPDRSVFHFCDDNSGFCQDVLEIKLAGCLICFLFPGEILEWKINGY